MAIQNSKIIQTEVNMEFWKKLKILAIQKDLSLPELIKELLEKAIQKKNINPTEEIVS